MGMEVAGSGIDYGNGEFRVKSFSNPQEKKNGKIDSADQWAAAKKIYTFCIVKYRSFDEPNLKAKIDQTDREIWKKNQQRVQILDRIKAKRLDRAQIIEQLISLGQEHRQYRTVLGEKISLMNPFKVTLGSLNGSNNAGRDKLTPFCSSEGKLNELIQHLNYRMKHEVISLPVEKQLIKEIKQLEGTRDKVIANVAMRAKIQESLGHKEATQDQVKLTGTDRDGVKKESELVKSKVKDLEHELTEIDNDIASLQLELTSILEKRDKAVETIHKLRKQRDAGNACFFQNRTLLNNAKELAAEKKLEALQKLSCEEIEKFMFSWNRSKSFRDDYKKRISASLDIRQLSRDGRMRNPDEKPLFLLQHIKPAEPQSMAKTTQKPAKEDPKPEKKQENLTVKNAEKESKRKQGDPKTILKPQNVVEDEYYVVELPKKETVKQDVVDEAKLKELKKQEEMEKQKQAMERKKKLAEKAAAKAALRAQKEAEKKQKEREKKMKKKELSSSNQDDTKFEKVEENVGEIKESKDISTTTGQCKGRTKERDVAIAKAILRRKRSNKYLLWVAFAAVVVAVILAISCNYPM